MLYTSVHMINVDGHITANKECWSEISSKTSESHEHDHHHHDITWHHTISRHHMTSHNITWHHMTSTISHDITWQSHNITWHHMTSHDTQYHMTSHNITWHHTTSHDNHTWHHTTSIASHHTFTRPYHSIHCYQHPLHWPGRSQTPSAQQWWRVVPQTMNHQLSPAETKTKWLMWMQISLMSISWLGSG